MRHSKEFQLLTEGTYVTFLFQVQKWNGKRNSSIICNYLSGRVLMVVFQKKSKSRRIVKKGTKPIVLNLTKSCFKECRQCILLCLEKSLKKYQKVVIRSNSRKYWEDSTFFRVLRKTSVTNGKAAVRIKLVDATFQRNFIWSEH